MDVPVRLVLLGHPVAHSISPRFQNAALEAAGIALTYELLDVHPTALDSTLSLLASERAAGNVTIPHKQQVAARCARLMPLAQRVGAVNVFWHEDGLLVGDNSDVGGAEAMMRALLGPSLAGARVAMIGAGGACSPASASTTGPAAREIARDAAGSTLRTTGRSLSGGARPGSSSRPPSVCRWAPGRCGWPAASGPKNATDRAPNGEACGSVAAAGVDPALSAREADMPSPIDSCSSVKTGTPERGERRRAT